MTVAPERLAVVDAAMLFDVLLPALRGHFGIRSSDLVDLARAHGLTAPPGEAAARPAEWQALLERLAGVEPLAAGEGPLRLLDIVRDLTDLVEGSVAPVSWWQSLLGGGGRQPTRDESVGQLLSLAGKLADGVALPPELVRPLIGRFSGALTHDEAAELARRLEGYGRDGWAALGANGVHADAWPAAYDHLLAGAREAAGRGRGLLYDSGY